MAEEARTLAAAASNCSHCGATSTKLKRCLRCMQVSYCGAECQRAAWKVGHKKTCVKQMSYMDILDKLGVADKACDWRGVLEFEFRFEQLMSLAETLENSATISDILCNTFLRAHTMEAMELGATGSLKAARVQVRRLDFQGRLGHWREQGDTMCDIAQTLISCDEGECGEHHLEEAKRYLQLARDLHATKEIFSAECRACFVLGQLAMKEGREEEGLELFRQSLSAAPFDEYEDHRTEYLVLAVFTDALFKRNAWDELDTLVSRFREVGKATSLKAGQLEYAELHSLYVAARFHQVRCIPSTRGPLWGYLKSQFSRDLVKFWR